MLVYLFDEILCKQGQNIEQEMDNLNLNLHAEEDGAEVEQGQEQGVVVVPVVDVGAAAAALQEEIVPVPPALLEPININNQVLMRTKHFLLS